MDQKVRTRRQRVLRTLAAVFASGSLFQTCETRLRDAFVMGTKDFVLSLFDPQNVLDQIAEDETTTP